MTDGEHVRVSPNGNGTFPLPRPPRERDPEEWVGGRTLVRRAFGSGCAAECPSHATWRRIDSAGAGFASASPRVHSRLHPSFVQQTTMRRDREEQARLPATSSVA